MSEPKWTKGPWGNSSTGVQMRSFSQSRAIFQEGKANLIASVFSDVAGGKETAEANARLIAAAPELYEALAALLDDTLVTADSYNTAEQRARGLNEGVAEDAPGLFVLITKAQVALAKARGE